MEATNGQLTMNTLLEVRNRLRDTLQSLSTNQWSALGSREDAIARTSLDGPNRDLDEECGYPITNPDVHYYKKQYDRGGISSRVVNIWPDECFAYHPDLTDTLEPKRTKFKKAFDALAKKHHLWSVIHRADRMSRIGHFGIVLLGLDDGSDLSKAPTGVNSKTGELRDGAKALKLIYLRVFYEHVVTVSTWEEDQNSFRYGQPVTYQINYNTESTEQLDQSSGEPPEAQTVHWTRVIHLADNRECSEVAGIPAMRPVLNYLCDIRKVAGSSAEMFWKGGFPGYAFEANPNLSGTDAIDEDALREDVFRFTNSLQRYITSVSGKWAALAQQIADPSANLTQQLTLLCATIGVPIRIFLGTESGHLASTQDASTWKERIHGRQVNYLEPFVVRPMIDRLMGLGCLPTVVEYFVNWRDLKSLGDMERADVGLKITQALMQYTTGDVQQLLPKKYLYTEALGFSEELADLIIAELEKNPPPPPVNIPPPAPVVAPAAKGPQGGGRKGNPAAKKVGRPTGPPTSNK